MTKVGAYLRVSGPDQSYEVQRPQVEAFCCQQGWQLAEVYAEKASSWTAGHQTELARLLADLEDGRRKYGRIVVVALDRLSRQGPYATLGLLDTFKRLGCPVASIREPWADSPMNEPMYCLISWFAKWESDSRSARTKAGQEYARKHGTKSGIGIGKRGKDKNPDGRRKAGYLARWTKVNKRPRRATLGQTESAEAA